VCDYLRAFVSLQCVFVSVHELDAIYPYFTSTCYVYTQGHQNTHTHTHTHTHTGVLEHKNVNACLAPVCSVDGTRVCVCVCVCV
jgi:hypothetical protein